MTLAVMLATPAVVAGFFSPLKHHVPRAEVRDELMGTPHLAAMGTLGATGRVAATGGPTPQQAMDEYLKAISPCIGATALVAVVTQHGEVVYEGAFGVRDVARGTPTTQDTLFQIGSTTKAFTTMLLGQLVSAGLLKWTDPVSMYLPEFVLMDEFADSRCTIADLLAHKTVRALDRCLCARAVCRHMDKWKEVASGRVQSRCVVVEEGDCHVSPVCCVSAVAVAVALRSYRPPGHSTQRRSVVRL